MSRNLCKTHEIAPYNEIAPTVVQPNRRRVRSDCSLSVQSLCGDLPMKKGLQQLTTFSHTIAGNSPFRIDGIAKRNRTDQEIKARILNKEFSAGVLLSATYGHLGLWRLKTCTEGSNPPRSARQSVVQRIPSLISGETRELCQFSAISARQTGLRRTASKVWSRILPPFSLQPR
jgi:hypothetical protein